MDTLKCTDTTMYHICAFCLYAGLRKNEALTLRRANIDLENDFANELSEFGDINQAAGFNAGYEIGFQKGIMTALKMLKADLPTRDEIVTIITKHVGITNGNT